MIVKRMVEKVNKPSKGSWRATIFFRNPSGKTKNQRRCKNVSCYGSTKKEALENAEFQLDIKMAKLSVAEIREEIKAAKEKAETILNINQETK